MQGLILLATFLVLAAISVATAIFGGIMVDKFPHVHDLLSVLVFFGTVVILLPISWLIAVKLTEPKDAASQ